MDISQTTREEPLTQDIAAQFEYLTQLVYFTSGTTAALSLAASLLLSNAGIGVAGVGAAGLSLYVLFPIRQQVSQTATTLLLDKDKEWQTHLTHVVVEAQSQIHTLTMERDTLLVARSKLDQTLSQVQQNNHDHLQQIESLTAKIRRLQDDKDLLQQTLSDQLEQAQTALEQAQNALTEKRHELAVHLDAVELQILNIWNPLYNGLVAICDRFDPTRPVTDLEYAGKPATLTEEEKRRWKHYRDSLTAYDSDLRERISKMSEECETHDEVYAFFLTTLEEFTVNYCKLWANVKDLELLTRHESEKRSIYSEFENFRNDYLNDANEWVEKSTTVEAGFNFIEESFKKEIASLQQRIVDAERLIEELQAPRIFRGETNVDKAGNRIIQHFAATGVILDAIESVKIPGGFQLRFKVDRNPDSTRLAESEFDKHCEHLGLWGLSQRPLDFNLDTRNFLLSVNLYGSAESNKQRPISESKRPTTKSAPPPPEQIAERFHELNCYSAAEFEEVVSLKFVPRVRVVAGSTGGKSPLLELIACAIAQIHKGQIWLINPIPGSPKDWFHIPGVVPPGTDGIQAAIRWLTAAHNEFKVRRNDLPGSAQKPFITVMVDEINAIARDFPDLGTVMKDFYQLSDHTRMGFLTAGQGGNVSGVSGGSQATRKTGNASKLMEEDFQNATQVFTAAAAKTWIEKHLKGGQMNTFLDRLTALNQLCAELNESEGKSAYPIDPTSKKVSPDAYRIALVVSPKEVEPFFIQIPPYSSYAGRLEEVTYPEGATVTAPQENQWALGLLTSHKPQSFTCSFCGSNTTRRKGTYRSTGQPRYVCTHCGRVPSTSQTVS